MCREFIDCISTMYRTSIEHISQMCRNHILNIYRKYIGRISNLTHESQPRSVQAVHACSHITSSSVPCLNIRSLHGNQDSLVCLVDCDDSVLGPLPGMCRPAPVPRADNTACTSSTPPGVHTDRSSPVPAPTVEPPLPLAASTKRHREHADSGPSSPPRDGSVSSSSDMADGL